MRFLAAVLLALAFAIPASAQPIDDEAARRTVAAIDAALKQRPNDAALWFYLARFQAQLGERKAVNAALEKVLELGEGFLPTRDGFEKMADDAQFQSLAARLEARLPRMDFAPTAIELQDRTVIPEGIAWDPHSKSFFIGSVAQRRILRVAEDHTVTEFAGAAANLNLVLGIAVDAPRRVLYAVSTNGFTDEAQKSRHNAVFAFDVDSRRLINRYDVPDALQLNDVAVAPGGRVFASDSQGGAIYEIPIKGPGPVRAVVPANQIRGSNGLAVSPDATRIYVAHSTGIAVVDIATGTFKRVSNGTRENISAIDGLYMHQGQLIGVQNFTHPGRAILIDLSRDGESITRVRTLLSHHHPALDEPTTAAVAGDYLFVLAATGVTHFNAQEKIERAETLKSPAVLKVLLPR